MRRILILHALLGTGHLSAARALDAAFARVPGVEAHVEDSLDFINPALSSLWKKSYKELSEHAAGLYSQVYRAADTADAQRAMTENLRGATHGWPFFQKLERYVAEGVACPRAHGLPRRRDERRPCHPPLSPLRPSLRDKRPSGNDASADDLPQPLANQPPLAVVGSPSARHLPRARYRAHCPHRSRRLLRWQE
ncbi:MAG: hypothetical protein EOM24_37540 [Chloroflexia bacterium]|nr:hypothetical protein [Chloroflexia bacterium]